MRLNTPGVLALVAIVALAGCTGFAPNATPGSGPGADTPETGETIDNADDPDEAASTGTVRFYVSDERNAIGDFEHLNVTITGVGFQAAGDTDGDDEETPENETATPTATNDTDAPGDNETEMPDENETDVPEDDESGEWIEYEVEDRTVDLTRLQGDNATLLSEFDVPTGNYTKVFVHVDGINATLENGESANVKLPSEKLQLTQGFTVEANGSVDFVFDITVHKAGNSGKYILTPVISESGIDVPIEDVGDDRNEDAKEERDEEDEESDEGTEDESDNAENAERDEANDALNATFVGPVEPGGEATIRASANGAPVANATVAVDGETVGMTDATGQLSFAVPEDAEELEVEIESGDAEAELETEFEDAPPAPPV